MHSPLCIIAESGASKTAWRLCAGQTVLNAIETMGLNPSSVSVDILQKVISSIGTKIKDQIVTEIHFYGAGLKFEKNVKILHTLLVEVFPQAQIFVEDDLTAAIRSTGREQGIVCILGTGSNACYFESFKPQSKLGGHGYILGDEGSGMDLGKHLLKGCLDKEFSNDICAYLEEKEGISLGEIRTAVYASDEPNKKLASFAPYLSQLKEDVQIQQLLQQRFIKFLTSTVCKFPESKLFPIDFVGGISAFFSDEIKQACEGLGLNSGAFYQSPIERLIKFHTYH